MTGAITGPTRQQYRPVQGEAARSAACRDDSNHSEGLAGCGRGRITRSAGFRPSPRSSAAAGWPPGLPGYSVPTRTRLDNARAWRHGAHRSVRMAPHRIGRPPVTGTRAPEMTPSWAHPLTRSFDAPHRNQRRSNRPRPQPGTPDSARPPRCSERDLPVGGPELYAGVRTPEAVRSDPHPVDAGPGQACPDPGPLELGGTSCRLTAGHAHEPGGTVRPPGYADASRS